MNEEFIFKTADNASVEEQKAAVELALAYKLPVDVIENPREMRTDVYIRIPKGLIFVRDMIESKAKLQEVKRP
jgi:hypothetical protein